MHAAYLRFQSEVMLQYFSSIPAGVIYTWMHDGNNIILYSLEKCKHHRTSLRE